MLRTALFCCLLLAVFGSVIATPAPAQADVILSELCDPRVNYLTDRFIEIYNSGGSAVDLTGWSIVAVGNGVDIFTWNLSGSILPGEALVAGDQTTVVAFQVDFPDEAWSNNTTTWNGKVGDGAKLLNASSTLVDNVLAGGSDFENQDYVRNSTIVTANPTYTPAEWTATPVDFPTQASPGSHTANPPVNGPTISGILIAPASPLPTDPVDVSADVVDTAAVITSVVLNWGTSPGSQPNLISMTVISGDTYQTATPIPPQPSGTLVYFTVEADNNAPATTVSPLQSYALPTVATVHAVQGEVATSPFAGEAVITSGVVTAAFASSFVIQDGAGAWDGMWVESGPAPNVGDSVSVRGLVDEASGNTLLTGVQLLSTAAGAFVPNASAVTTAQAASEAYEGVLVGVANAICTAPDLGGGEWEVDDGSAPLRVDDLGYPFAPTLGSGYSVTGPVTFADGIFKIEPRNAADVVWTGDAAAPIIFSTLPETDTTLRVTFSEDVDPTTGETAANYSIPGLTVSNAQRDPALHDEVVLTVSAMSTTNYTLTVNGVEDLFGNAMVFVTSNFNFYSNDIPPGYYDPAAGLTGEPLQIALHDIIKNHTVRTYDFSWSAFQTTDDKPNGKVWDTYSDVPGGTPAYEYTFVTDQCGNYSGEGICYNREHSWPKSWYGGDVSPMFSDLFLLYPTDGYVNNQRGSLPFGEVSFPAWTSTNGSKVGNCSFPGYSGVVFEPIDEYKGDFARTYFYMTVRYYSEDAGWPGSPMSTGSQLLPWAVDLLVQWHENDPVSLKEFERNSAVFGFQDNRNPFIDHANYVDLIYGTPTSTREVDLRPAALLYPTSPNPFHASTSIRFEVPAAQDLRLAVYDVSGKQVALLASGQFQPGLHEVTWNGRMPDGRKAGSGIYFALLQTGNITAVQRMALLR